MQEFIPFIKENLILGIVWVGLFAALVVSFVKQKTARYQWASPTEATLLMNHKEGLMVDVRSRDEFRAGHIAGAVNLAAKEIKDGNLASIENHRTAPIIVVCKTGQTAIESANQLIDAGFEQVYVLKDGLISWNEAKLPLVSGKKKK